jgi:uncharacterized protein YyaL (SSP411 family)
MRATLSKLPWRALSRVPSARAVARATQRSVAEPTDSANPEESLEAAYRWLCDAQDATSDGGVAGWFHLLEGWSASYPETTGYIIPTFLRYATLRHDPDARRRALQMADWEIDIQLESGAVRSGLVSQPVGPAVFNTGQVLFGWTAAWELTRDERYAQALDRAARWLVEQQDEDGAWRRNLSLLAKGSVHTYNVRSAWGLAAAGRALSEERWVQAARRNCDWALEQQQENGWFAHTGFADGEVPLLHTIGYVLEGLFGVGALLGDDLYVEAARRGAQQLVECHRRRGRLHGRYDDQWRPTVSWRCLTGEAQVAIVLYRLSHLTGEPSWAETARHLLDGLIKIQDRDTSFAPSRGGIPGSQPVWGGYCPLLYINWAAKFFVDALLLEIHGAEAKRFVPVGEPLACSSSPAATPPPPPPQVAS